MSVDINKTLESVGLKETDIKIYTFCLSRALGAFTHEITKATGINRSTIDLAINRLLDMGYLQKIKEGRRWKYKGTKPEDILARQELLLEDMRQAVPILSSLVSHDSRIDVQFYDGFDGLRRAYDQVIAVMRNLPDDTDAGHMLAITNGQKQHLVFPDWQKQFIERRKRLKRSYKVVAPESSRRSHHWSVNPTNLRDARYIPDEKFPFNITMEMFGEYVLIYTAIQPVGGVMIRNAVVADSMRCLHTVLWNVGS